MKEVIPEYKDVKGWKTQIRQIKDFSSLPQAFKDYIHLIEELVQAEIAVVSTGMERKDTLFRDDVSVEGLDMERIKAEI